jgi:DASH complex subunit Hsk3 like
MSTTNNANPASRAPSGPNTSNKNRQYAHLHAQLAQLNAHLADTENLVRMTAVQAQDMRFLGGYVGAMFMGSARVLGEESVVRAESRQESAGGAVVGKGV